MIWLEIVIGFAVPMAWGAWQLIDLRRERKRDEFAATGGARTEPRRAGGTDPS